MVLIHYHMFIIHNNICYHISIVIYYYILSYFPGPDALHQPPAPWTRDRPNHDTVLLQPGTLRSELGLPQDTRQQLVGWCRQCTWTWAKHMDSLSTLLHKRHFCTEIRTFLKFNISASLSQSGDERTTAYQAFYSLDHFLIFIIGSTF